MKKLKGIIVLVLVLILTTSLATVSDAAYKSTGKSFQIKRGGFLGIGATTYKYYVYKDSVEWYAMFHNYDVCPPIRHRQNRGETTLTYACSQSLSSESTYAFSLAMGCKAGSDIVNGTVSATGSQSRTRSYSIGATGSVGETIPARASTGYYKMTLCHNFYKYKLSEYVGNRRTNTYYTAVPKGSPYVGVLYGKSTENSSYRLY